MRQTYSDKHICGSGLSYGDSVFRRALAWHYRQHAVPTAYSEFTHVRFLRVAMRMRGRCNSSGSELSHGHPASYRLLRAASRSLARYPRMWPLSTNAGQFGVVRWRLMKPHVPGSLSRFNHTCRQLFVNPRQSQTGLYDLPLLVSKPRLSGPTLWKFYYDLSHFET